MACYTAFLSGKKIGITSLWEDLEDKLLGYPWKLWGIPVQTSPVEGRWHQNWVCSRPTKNVYKYSLRSILLHILYQFFLTNIFFNFNSSLQIFCEVLKLDVNLNFLSSISILLYKSAAGSFNLNFVPFYKESRLCLTVVHISRTYHGHLQYFCKTEY